MRRVEFINSFRFIYLLRAGLNNNFPSFSSKTQGFGEIVKFAIKNHYLGNGEFTVLWERTSLHLSMNVQHPRLQTPKSGG